MKQDQKSTESNAEPNIRSGMRYFWLYGSILFAVALGLVIFSAKLQSDTINQQKQTISAQQNEIQNAISEKEQEKNKSKSALENITEINEALTQQVANLQLEIDAQGKEIERLSQENSVKDEYIHSQRLMQVQNLYNNNQKKEAKELLETVNINKLAADAKTMMEFLAKKLNFKIDYQMQDEPEQENIN